MKKVEGYLLSVLFALALAAGGLSLFLLPHDSYSASERRQLANPPECSWDAVMNGRFFEEADDWAADHFAGREFFRRLKAIFQTAILRENENDGFAVVDGSIVKLEKRANEDALSYAAKRFSAIYDEYLKDRSCRVYCALIPDKSHFLAARGYPVMDYSVPEESFYGSLPGATPIPLADVLSLDDYYRTDSHWRQERILPAANLLLRSMGGEGKLAASDFEEKTYAPFYGVYAEQSALDPLPDTIVYLDGGPIADARLLDFGSMQVLSLYDPEGFDARDPYTLFCGGAKGFLRIENPNVKTGRELVIFRDSFAASIAPLLASEYASVTLIDTRYFQPSLIGRYLRFDRQDVLFLYSVTLLNNSQGLN